MERILASALTLSLTACAAPQPGAGAGLTIVSMNPCTDAILAEVADPQQLLAISSYSQDPASSSMDLARAKAMNAVSGTVEEVLALRPGIVIGSSFTPPGTRMALERLGYRFEAVGLAATVEESRNQVRALARIAGHPERGEALVARIDAALAAAAPLPGPPITAVVWQSGGIVPGQGTLINDLLERTGFVNYAAQRGLHQADVLGLEAMLIDPPQVIFTAGNRYSEEDRLLAHPALATLSGTHRAAFDSKLLWCGGPTIVRAVARLVQVRSELGNGGARASTSSAGADLGTEFKRKGPLRLSLSKPPRNSGPTP